MGRRRMRLGASTVPLAAAGSVLLAVAGARAQGVFVNEIHYDNVDTDVNEFVEIAGPAGTDLMGWSVELYNGATAARYDVIDLGGVIDDEGSGFGALHFLRPGIQNGSPDGLALVDGGGSVVEFLCYAGTFVADGGAADGLACTDIGVAEADPIPDPGQSLQRVGEGFEASDFTWTGPAADSPGDINCGQILGGEGEGQPGLVHRYSFSGDARDSVGCAHGIIVDAGVAQNAVFLDGELDLSANDGEFSNVITEDAYVDLPNGIVSAAASSGTSGALSFEFWFTLAETRTWSRLGDFGTSNDGEDTSTSGHLSNFVAIVASSGRWADGLEMTNHPASDAGEPQVGAAGPLATGVEHHVVAVYDHGDLSAGSNGTMRLYLNAVELLDTGSTDGEIHAELDLTTMLDDNNWLGRSQWNDPLFDGWYDEFRIYDVALGPDDVAAHFAAGPDALPEPLAASQLLVAFACLLWLRRRP